MEVNKRPWREASLDEELICRRREQRQIVHGKCPYIFGHSQPKVPAVSRP